MSETIQAAASTALAEVETVTRAILPAPVAELPTAATAPAAEIEKRMAEIDLSNTQSIISFGSGAQAELQVISQEMLNGVKNKDVGPAGAALTEIVATIRGFSGSELDAGRERSWWERLTGAASPVVQFMERYEQVQTQIDKITGNLMGHQTLLLKDIKALDILYAKTLTFFDELGLYIAAGKAKIAELDTKTIPAAEAAVSAAPADDQVKKAQELRDIRAARDDLERRVADLQLTC